MSFTLTHLIGFGASPAATGGTPYTETGSAANGSGAGASFTMVSREWAIDNGATINSVGVYSTTAATITVKIALENSSTSFDFVVSESYSHGGTGWEDKTLTSPYVVPGSGTYRAALYTATTINCVTSTARSYKSGDQTGTGNTGFTADTSNAPVMRVTGTI